MKSQSVSELARKWAARTAVLFVYLAMVSAGLGWYSHHGGFVANACLCAGVSLAAWLWHQHSAGLPFTLRTLTSLTTFAGASGLALYANAIWALWAIGVPVDIGTVRDGRMGEHFWLGPLTLVYAVFSYLVLRASKRKATVES